MDSGVNKTLEIFGFMINSKKIDLNHYEIKERKNDGFNFLVKDIQKNYNTYKNNDNANENFNHNYSNKTIINNNTNN